MSLKIRSVHRAGLPILLAGVLTAAWTAALGPTRIFNRPGHNTPPSDSRALAFSTDSTAAGPIGTAKDLLSRGANAGGVLHSEPPAASPCTNASCVFLPVVSLELFDLSAYLSCGRQQPYSITGEVTNLASSTVYSITLKAVVYDENNDPHTYTGAPLFGATFPGKPNPFGIATDLGYECWPDMRGLEVSVSSFSWSSAVAYRPVTVVSIFVQSIAYGSRIYGEIRNDNAADLQAIIVLVEATDDVATSRLATLTQDHLAPGETTDYWADFIHPWTPLGGPLAVQGQGRVSP